MTQVRLLLLLYTSPLRAFSRIMDEGRLLFAVVAAVAATLAVQVPRTAEYYGQMVKQYAEMAKARQAVMAAKPAANAQAAKEAESDDEEDVQPAAFMPGMPSLGGPPPLWRAVNEFLLLQPNQYFRALLALAICFVPVAIFILTLWDRLGGFTTILFRDYMALLVSGLLAWTAAYLPLAAANFTLGCLHSPAHGHPALWWGAHTLFLAWMMCAVRTVMGTGFGHAAGAVSGAWAGAVGGLWLQWLFGGAASWLASPFVLYYLYNGLNPEFRSLGGGLRSRQRLKQHLEISTLNPRDADAHYQLGLIYQQRRQLVLAEERFQKAIEIDPSEPDAYHQLGRMAIERQQYAEGLGYFEKAARIDDKHASSEVWREMGIAHFCLSHFAEARQALEKYLGRRPYDPEGLCWYGRALARLDAPEAASEAFQQAIEAVRTMPPARKRQVQRWAGEAEKELKSLPRTVAAR